MKLDNFPNKILSTAEENEIAVEVDKEQLVLHNMREALLYAKKCSFGKLSDGDLISVCYLGLRDAAANFAPNKIRFFGYSKPYIRGRIYSEFRSLRVVKKSKSVSYVPLDCDAPEESEWICSPVTGRKDNLDREWKPITSESESFDTETIQLKEEWSLLAPLVQGVVTDKERLILELRYISGMNFRQIGDLFAIRVSRSHIQHLHGTALAKIRAEMVKQGLPLHYSK